MFKIAQAHVNLSDNQSYIDKVVYAKGINRVVLVVQRTRVGTVIKVTFRGSHAQRLNVTALSGSTSCINSDFYPRRNAEEWRVRTPK